MKPITLLLLLSFFCTFSFAQNIPEVKLDDNKTLELSELHVSVNITGNVALTTYHMKFYNDADRILEGELAFPLGQGQSVTDFAMDVNGELRHAVIVEKELARVAYENTIRQRIDPGLLEKTKGNNYKARVYPIPAKGYKELLITYEEVLTANDQKHKYILPLDFKKSISDFSIDITVQDKQNVHLVNNRYYKSLRLYNENENKKVTFSKQNFTPKEEIQIEMLLDNQESISTYNNYFNLYKTFQPKTKLKNKPKTITLFWDASYSMEYRDIESEMKLLDKYFDYLRNVAVNLVVFNMNVKKEQEFYIKNGNWLKLKNELTNVTYDGGTSFKKLSRYKSDEYLFFTDCMFNLGDFNLPEKASVYTINALKSANHVRLSQIATKTGANYINLKTQSIETAFHTLTNQVYQFLGIKLNEDVSDLFPRKNTNVNEDFSFSGKFKRNTIIELLFGYNNQPSDTVKVEIKGRINNPLVKRLWAKQKLIALNHNSEANKEEIIVLAKKNNLITTYTSMIILDRIEDYVRYKIEPPSGLKNQYKALVKREENREQERLEEIESRKEDLYDDYKSLLNWYNRDFSKPKKIKTEISNSRNQVVRNETETANQNENSTNQINTSISNSESRLDSSKRIIRGTIYEVNGAPLAGANVFVLGKNNGVVTDFDGNYAINAEVGDKLVFSFIGFTTNEVVVGSHNTINIDLREDESLLDEVIVVGYGTQKRVEVTGAVTMIKSESITNTLQGSVAGVQVQAASGQPGSDTRITIRGNNSLNNNNAPLYIVDGAIYDEGEFKKIATADIDNISVVKDAAASAIYGSRASNGLIVVTTKKGLEEKHDEIEALNEKLDKAISFKPWSPNADYLVELSRAESTKGAYSKYLEIRQHYRNTPTFFMDVADYFDSINEKDIALQIVTNLIEIEIDNHELIRALAYKLEYFEKFDLAVFVYEEVLKLRPEEPHSYRDLALAYQEVGEYQKAFDLLYKIIDGKLLEKDQEERFYGIEHLAYVEVCNLVSKHKGKLDLDKHQKKIFKEFKVDLRVVVDWNHNNTDLDLWVESPKSEKVSYKNTNSEEGGRISEDLTEGYGPEEFMIKKASKGDYKISVDYFNDQVQKVSGPTTLKISIYTNYGSVNEKKEVRILRLDKEEDDVEVGTVSI